MAADGLFPTLEALSSFWTLKPRRTHPGGRMMELLELPQHSQPTASRFPSPDHPVLDGARGARTSQCPPGIPASMGRGLLLPPFPEISFSSTQERENGQSQRRAGSAEHPRQVRGAREALEHHPALPSPSHRAHPAAPAAHTPKDPNSLSLVYSAHFFFPSTRT